MLEHGGNILDAIAQFRRPREDWLDLSTGINPHAYPVACLADDAWQRLPETDPTLVQAASHYYQAGELLAVAGTQAAIQALPILRRHDSRKSFGSIGSIDTPARVSIASPTYAEHAYQWSRAGHAVREISYQCFDAAALDCDVMVVCNPNNPTGATVAPQRLLACAEQLARRGGWLVVDEAFADMTPALSVASYAARPGLIVLRSIGKFFGLAGLRLGFVAAETTLLVALSDMLGPWAISGPAQQIGKSALQDRPWQSAMCCRLAAEGQRLNALLAAHGLAAQGTALFQWCRQTNAATATTLWRHMAQHGIWVRLFTQAACGVRFGLPPDEFDWQRLTQALSSYADSVIHTPDHVL